MLAVFLCTGCTVCSDHMDVKEQRCTGCTVWGDHMAVPSHPWLHGINTSMYVDVKEQRCTGCAVCCAHMGGS
ncbi:MAG: hypothetical protein ACJA2G_002258 [Cognaticolwellia sp.]|jgi:hypothetical protein